MCSTAQFDFFFLIKVFSVINFVAISRNNKVIGVASKAIDNQSVTGASRIRFFYSHMRDTDTKDTARPK